MTQVVAHLREVGPAAQGVRAVGVAQEVWRDRDPLIPPDGRRVVEQDHRAVKRMTRPIQGFKDFRSAPIILGGVELMHMIRKGQMRDDGRGLSAAQQFLHAGGVTPTGSLT